MGVLRQTLAFAAAALAALCCASEVGARGLPAAQSDSACAAYVAGRDPSAYVKGCSDLIARLKETKSKCASVANLPASARYNADPQGYCTPANASLLNDQLAAAYNDRAYFLIQCRGSENYRLAVADLTEADRLMDGKYTIAIRNRAIAYMLLGEYAQAKADFLSLIDRLRTSSSAVLVRPLSEAEIHLGLGFAEIGLCEVAPAQEQLVETERLSLAPIAGDPWLRAAALFGQGLALKVKGVAQERIAATNNAVTAAEKGRLQRYGAELKAQGEARMQAARALVGSIQGDIKDQFSIEEPVVLTKCRDAKLGA